MGKQKKGTKQNRFRTILKALKMELREHRSSFLVYFDVDPFDHAKSCTGDI